MPISNPLHIPTLVHFASRVKPLRVLDVGIGLGCNGFILRQFLDVTANRVQPCDWITRIDGIEIFEAYRNPVWDYAYDEVFIGDAFRIIPDLDNYDLITCTDVLEHLSKDAAKDAVRMMLDKGQIVFSTTPNQFIPQGAWGGNPAEEHKCLLHSDDFESLVTTQSTGVTTCYICARSADAQKLVRNINETCPQVKSCSMRHVPKRVFRKLYRMSFGRR